MKIFAANIKISPDKNGRRRAQYWSMRQLRWFPLPIAEADAIIAAEGAPVEPTAVDIEAVRNWRVVEA